MKTPDDIINQFDSNDEYPAYYHESSIQEMMKQYAKQWVVIAVALAGKDREIKTNELTARLLEGKIDAQ